MSSIVKLDKKILGKGSYGEVFLSIDTRNNKELAVKKCGIGKSGIPNLMESYIMSSLVHPHLNGANKVVASESNLYIVQERAEMDLGKKLRSPEYRSATMITLDKIKSWCHSIAQAVACLHSNDIIHADIKGSNVLLFNDENVKLTDFTLSTKKWRKDDRFKHTVCTYTHRPPECFLKSEWDESLDIWSLGCTFYEIAYGKLLFPYQGKDLEKDKGERKKEPKTSGDKKKLKLKEKERRTILNQRMINAMIDWSRSDYQSKYDVYHGGRYRSHRRSLPPTKGKGKRTGSGESSSSSSSYPTLRNTKLKTMEKYLIDHQSYDLSDRFNDQEMSLFNDLICKMLRVIPEERINIFEVLRHPFFEGIEEFEFSVIQKGIIPITPAKEKTIIRQIHRYIGEDDDDVTRLALSIYSQCLDMDQTELSDGMKLLSCVWIANKIVKGTILPYTIPLHEILPAERKICHYLRFNFSI